MTNLRSTSLIGTFYSQLNDFKDKFVQILLKLKRFEEIKGIEKNFKKLMMVKKVNVRLPIEYFYNEGVVHYTREILTKDTSFFIQSTNHLDKEQADSYGIDDHHLFLIKQIGPIWEYLSPEVKNNIWNYILVICFIAEKILGRDDLHQTRLALRSIK